MVACEAEGRVWTKVGKWGNMEEVGEVFSFPTCLDGA